MDIGKIEIALEDNVAFAHVATLIDKQGFINDVETIRQKYGIENPLERTLKAFQDHFLVIAGLTLGEFKRDTQTVINSDGFEVLFGNLDKLLEYLTENHDELDDDPTAFKKVLSLENQFLEEVKALVRKHKYYPIFDTVALQAIVFNEVSYFMTVYPILISELLSNYDAKEFDKNRDAEMAIFVTPFSTEKDLKLALETVKKDLINLLGENYPSYVDLPKDIISNIKRNREWYWWNHSSNKKRLGYRKISEQTDTNIETVKSAIRSYKNLL